MGRCFVIQPFDGGAFDKRYEDVFVPAITQAGLEPYRVDRDPGVTIPIDDIEEGIRTADVCLADISLDNPNIWYELGYALASQKDVVLVCALERRTVFPFDVRHRTIITYSTDSARDFQHLKDRIVARLQAILNKEASIEKVAALSPIISVEGLEQHEISCLVCVAQNLDNPLDAVSSYTVFSDMGRFGFTRLAVTLALASLLRKQLITLVTDGDYNNNQRSMYGMTESGLHWLEQNQHLLLLRKQQATPRPEPPPISDDLDESDPFADE